MWLRASDVPASVAQNYPLRITTYGVIFLLHLSLFWGQQSVGFWFFVVFQGLIYPHLAYALVPNNATEHRLLLGDAVSYGVHMAVWGFNPYLVSLYTAAMGVTYWSVAGKPMVLKALAGYSLGLLAGGVGTQWHFAAHIPLPTLLILSVGFTLYMLKLGELVYATNRKLRRARKQALEQQDELLLTNRLVAAVNSSLDIDAILQAIMEGVQRYYPFESLYMLPYSDDKKALVITGIYGASVTQEERDSFLMMQFNVTEDANSIFVWALQRNKVLYVPQVSADNVAQSAPIDQHLYRIKASKSMLYIPLCINNEVVAGAAFFNFETPFTLAPEDIARIKQFLIHAAGAVRNQNLIRELQNASAQANAARLAAEKSEEAKGRFLANMSHEIRTPLTAILGYAELLTEKSLTPTDQEKFTQIILHSGQHLLAMINDILDIAKIEAGKMRVEILPCPLASVIKPLQDMISLKVQEKGLQFFLELNYPLPSQINTDITRLSQILVNLLNNAVKFTHQGSITLQIGYAHNQMVFKVIDTGIGIDENRVQHLFAAFTQADTSTTRLYGGTGLGLFISKNMAVLLGGELTVESRLGKGSVFSLSLPCATPTHTLNSPQQLEQSWQALQIPLSPLAPSGFKGRLLIAEDHLENQRLLSVILTGLGVAFDFANNGAEALAYACRNTYALILLDMQMPYVGGKTAAEVLIRLGCRVPIIAFTANVMTHQRAEYDRIGFKGVLEKPFNRQQVLQLLHRHLSASPAPRAAFIVDDDSVNILLAKQFLRSLQPDIQLQEALSAEAAIDAIGPQTPLDFILMDLHLPGMNGYEATAQLRAKGVLAPVYILSANSGSQYLEAALACGAQGFIEKPINKVKLQPLLE